jgi:hypothetical protein
MGKTMRKTMRKSHYKKGKKGSHKHIKRVYLKKGKFFNKKSRRVSKGRSRKHSSSRRVSKSRSRKHSRSRSRRVGRGRSRRGAGCGCGMTGGMVSSPAAGPVGYSWQGGNEASWPGAAASQGLDTQGKTMSNHFKVSPNGVVVGGIDPYSGTSNQNGGRKRKGKGKKQKGGFFQEIVNLGRGAQYGVNGGYFNLVGKQQPISQNPYPTEDQPIDVNYKMIGAAPPNVRNIYVDANNQVAKI